MAYCRTKQSLKNSTIAIIYFAINLFLQFFSRKIFLDYLGTEILGLNTTAVNLLQFLNLAELGINAAVGFSLYDPINRKDENSINEIIHLQCYLYRRIGLIILAGAIILMLFFPAIFSKSKLPLWYAYSSFSVLLLSSLIGYFYNYKQVLLTASQQHYKITYSFNSIMLVKILFQIVCVRYFKNPYIWWLIFEGVFAIIGAYSLQHMTKRTFPFLSSTNLSFKELKQKYFSLTIKIKQLFFHKIVALIITQSSPLIIYAYTSLSMVALYGNYSLIIAGITNLFNTVFNSIGAGIGNLVVSSDIDHVWVTFRELFSLRIYILSVFSFCVVALSNQFITLWIGAQYILDDLTLWLMVLIMFSTLTRYTIESFIMAYGLVQDIWAPIIEGILNLGLAIILGYYYGLHGILLGTLMSLIVIGQGWKPYFLFTRKMSQFYKGYLWLFFKHLLLIFLAYIFSFKVLKLFEVNVASSWIVFLMNAIITFAVICFLLGLILMLFRCEIVYFINRIKYLYGRH